MYNHSVIVYYILLYHIVSKFMFVYVLHRYHQSNIYVYILSILQLDAIRCVRLDAPAVGRYKQAVYHRSSEAVWTERKCRACTILLDFQVYLLVLHHKTQEEHACILHVLKYIIYIMVDTLCSPLNIDYREVAKDNRFQLSC